MNPLRSFVYPFAAAAGCLIFLCTLQNSSAEGTLVAHYEFEDADELGKDSSGMENHAEVFDVEQADGAIGQGGFFDESLGSSFVKTEGLAGFTGKPGLTLAAWVKLDDATTGFDGIISQDFGACCDNRLLLTPEQLPFMNLSEHQDEQFPDATPVEIEEWVHIAMTGLDGDGEAEGRVFINGEEVEGSPRFFPEIDDGSEWTTYLGAGEGGTSHPLTGTLDDVRIYEGALTEAEIRELIPEDIDPDTDTDGDGLPDSWESSNGLDPGNAADAAGDPDGDTLTSLQEFEKGTNPNSDDTDEDGLKDNVETGTGTWMSATDTGTDPKEADSDGDGLSDNVETNTATFVSVMNTGTDPNTRDSDGDGFSDNSEVTLGSDPTKAESVPDSGEAVLVAHYSFEDADNLGFDSSGMENHAEVAEVSQATGANGQTDDGAFDFGRGAFFDEDLASSFIKADGLAGFTGKPGVTLAAWVKLDDATTGFDGIISQDAGGCCDNRILLHPDSKAPFINLSEHQDEHLTDASPVEIGEWTHIAMTGLDMGGEAEARVYINGVEVEGGPWVYPELDDGSEWNTYLGAGEAGTAHRLTGTLDDVRIYQGALTGEQIQELLKSGGVELEVKRISKSATELTLQWQSRPGASYRVEYTSDLTSEDWLELDDGVDSEGELTEFTDDDPEHLALPEGFYRVGEN